MRRISIAPFFAFATCPVRRNDCTGGGVEGRISIVNKEKILVMDDEEMEIVGQLAKE